MQCIKVLLSRKPFALLLLLIFLNTAQIFAGQKAQQRAAVNKATAPRDILGFTPGDDYKLASWAQSSR